MKTSDFYYDLPEELIAQNPVEPRDSSRLLVYDRKKDRIEHKIFRDISDLLTDNDVLVINNTRVIPARLYGIKRETGAKIEILLLKRLSLTEYEALAKPGKKVPVGTIIDFSDNLYGKIVDNIEEIAGKKIELFVKQGTLEAELDRIGEMPLPPYIKEKLKTKERYQTVYSKIPGSSAAPTAGLHFTKELMEKLKAKGVIFEEVLLEVGLGTFRPVQVESIENHHMHSEEIVVTEDVAKRLNEYKKQGKRIIAVGTTSVRTLESATNEKGEIEAVKKSTNIFIYPGYNFKFVDSIITNFHLPESTLIMLISAFVGRENTLEIYNHAVKERYRFFSFGDSMFLQ
ncbi:MAG: tRNA preQ1(34) S-adenosylmethionine ribosyltransferase-isomerase QueA [Clostridia bacterium]|nr:tRNA preQ1(34) S-adenosylmethionine ribosyltransferase-isomerase QueA [Clostridia bacterium]